MCARPCPSALSRIAAGQLQLLPSGILAPRHRPCFAAPPRAQAPAPALWVSTREQARQAAPAPSLHRLALTPLSNVYGGLLATGPANTKARDIVDRRTAVRTGRPSQGTRAAAVQRAGRTRRCLRTMRWPGNEQGSERNMTNGAGQGKYRRQRGTHWPSAVGHSVLIENKPPPRTDPD